MGYTRQRNLKQLSSGPSCESALYYYIFFFCGVAALAASMRSKTKCRKKEPRPILAKETAAIPIHWVPR